MFPVLPELMKTMPTTLHEVQIQVNDIFSRLLNDQKLDGPLLRKLIMATKLAVALVWNKVGNFQLWPEAATHYLLEFFRSLTRKVRDGNHLSEKDVKQVMILSAPLSFGTIHCIPGTSDDEELPKILQELSAFTDAVNGDEQAKEECVGAMNKLHSIMERARAVILEREKNNLKCAVSPPRPKALRDGSTSLAQQMTTLMGWKRGATLQTISELSDEHGRKMKTLFSQFLLGYLLSYRHLSSVVNDPMDLNDALTQYAQKFTE